MWLLLMVLGCVSGQEHGMADLAEPGVHDTGCDPVQVWSPTEGWYDNCDEGEGDTGDTGEATPRDTGWPDPGLG